jgi:hypothetical protein
VGAAAVAAVAAAAVAVAVPGPAVVADRVAAPEAAAHDRVAALGAVVAGRVAAPGPVVAGRAAGATRGPVVEVVVGQGPIARRLSASPAAEGGPMLAPDRVAAIGRAVVVEETWLTGPVAAVDQTSGRGRATDRVPVTDPAEEEEISRTDPVVAAGLTLAGRGLAIDPMSEAGRELATAPTWVAGRGLATVQTSVAGRGLATVQTSVAGRGSATDPTSAGLAVAAAQTLVGGPGLVTGPESRNYLPTGPTLGAEAVSGAVWAPRWGQGQGQPSVPALPTA